ncbi:acid ceramidase-like [Panulirus ornatus]|uniref:acid ceramidase-like n=1 Tax=Panulirus ornatus TaxID=150431 RepID=UPI003A85B4C4
MIRQALLFLLTLPYIQARIEPFTGCETNAFPPNQSDAVPHYTINLDLTPEERWTKLLMEKKGHMLALIDDVRNLTISLLGQKVFSFINNNLEKIASSLPQPYFGEIKGIAKATGLPVSEVTLYNIFYEVFTFCTSIIAQDTSGNIYHGRNLDFGLFMGWDPKKHSWRVAELLKPLIVHLGWIKGGKLVYESVNYAGYVGILTAVKKNQFTFSLDERFGLNGGYIGILEWVLFKDHKQKWVSFLTREVMENAKTYEEAKHMFSHTRLLAPVYFILGGAKKGEGSIITRWRDNFHINDLQEHMSGSESWFLVETNYDQWKSPPFFDDRRTPAVHCLKLRGQKNASPKLIYNVLSTKPVFNKLTTYTSLMDVNRGYIGAWLRRCEDPCWPW